MRGKTLREKAFGPGYRDRLLTHTIRVFERCVVAGCNQPCYAILGLYVDARPPASQRGWYADVLRSIPVGSETELGFCTSHAEDVIHMDYEFMDNPDLWEPGRTNPPVMPGPGRLLHPAVSGP